MPNRLSIGPCPKCRAELVCSYNHFVRDTLTIQSWEHKCANCGFRETRAFRNDQPPPADEPAPDPAVCPFCGRRPL